MWVGIAVGIAFVTINFMFSEDKKVTKFNFFILLLDTYLLGLSKIECKTFLMSNFSGL